MSAMDEEATQPATQPLPVHNGIAPSTANGNYLAGVLCLLHPSSPAAYEIVERTAHFRPGVVLRLPTPATRRSVSPEAYSEDDEEQLTQVTAPRPAESEDSGLDIALRIDPGPKDPRLGFIFGRNPHRCDVVLGEQSKVKRVSNFHFRIYQNTQGVLMLQDSSTNGTWVDDHKLGGLSQDGGKSEDNQRALFAGTVIHLAPGPRLLRFIVRIPTQDGTKLAPERTVSPAGDSQLRNVGIDPGPPPQFSAPKLLPKQTTAVPKSPHRNLAAVQRGPFTAQGKNPIALHNAKAIKYNDHDSWDGGDKYKLEGIIGKGAFATVRRAVDRRTGDAYAVKTIQKRTLAHAGDKNLGVRKEVEILEKLNHPNIVSYIDCHEDRSHIYIFMELITGGDLNEYLGKHGALPLDMVQEVSRQVLRGIEYVHSMGISHRDLKPDNILLASEDPIEVKISDFGLAKMVQNEETFLKTFCGTMLFLAPEVFPGYATALVDGGGSMKRKRNPREDAGREDGRGAKQRRRYNQAVDMWSLGCVIYMLLTGSAPFQGKNQDDMLRIILRGKFDSGPLQDQLGIAAYEAKEFIERLLQVTPGMRMMEQEALRHPWLYNGSEQESSMEVVYEDEDDEDDGGDGDDGVEEETEGPNGFQKVAEQKERWMMVQGPGRRPNVEGPRVGELSESNDEEDSEDETPRNQQEDIQDVQLRKAVTDFSFKGEAQAPQNAARSDSGSSDESYASLEDAESNGGSRRMFRPPPGISVQGSSGVFPDNGLSMYSDEGIRGGDEPFPSRVHEPFEFDELRVNKPQRDGQRSGSKSRSVSGGSLGGAEAMVGKLKVASPSPHDSPSPTSLEFRHQQRQTTPTNPKANVNNDSPASAVPSSHQNQHQDQKHSSPQPDSFESQPAVEYFTPASLFTSNHLQSSIEFRYQSPPAPPPSALSIMPTSDENLPPTQPTNFCQPSPQSCFAVPTTPWGRLIPIEGSIPHPTILLNRQQISIGRSFNCTYVETDIRISKHHIAVQLAAVDCDLDEGRSWQPASGMLAWYSIQGTNGCILNGKKKHKGRVGRIFDGDTFYLFKDNTSGPVEFLGFRCEFTIGDHVREMAETSDSDGPDELKAKRKGSDYLSGGISMATTVAVATPKAADALSMEGLV